MRRALPIALLLLGTAALPSGAQAARTGGLTVRSVSAPRSATAGSPITVDVRATRIGIATEQVNAAPSGQTEVDVPLGLSPLTRAYRHLKFGPDVTEITALTPNNPSLHVEALLKFRDGSTATEDWSNRRFAMFCPQATGQRLDEAVLVISNTSQTQTVPADPR